MNFLKYVIVFFICTALFITPYGFVSHRNTHNNTGSYLASQEAKTLGLININEANLQQIQAFKKIPKSNPVKQIVKREAIRTKYLSEEIYPTVSTNCIREQLYHITASLQGATVSPPNGYSMKNVNTLIRKLCMSYSPNQRSKKRILKNSRDFISLNNFRIPAPKEGTSKPQIPFDKKKIELINAYSVILKEKKENILNLHIIATNKINILESRTNENGCSVSELKQTLNIPVMTEIGYETLPDAYNSHLLFLESLNINMLTLITTIEKSLLEDMEATDQVDFIDNIKLLLEFFEDSEKYASKICRILGVLEE